MCSIRYARNKVLLVKVIGDFARFIWDGGVRLKTILSGWYVNGEIAFIILSPYFSFGNFLPATCCQNSENLIRIRHRLPSN